MYSILKSLLLLTFLLGVDAFAEDPVFDSIDYASPKKYLELADCLGDREAIATLSTKLKATSDQHTLSNVIRWMKVNLRYDGTLAYAWRNCDSVLGDRCYGGCADQAIICGALLKSTGIPVVWVKTMDVKWIWDFKLKRPFETWSGHVFLEVYLDGKWVLLDPGAEKIYTNYAFQSRLLPGERFAYHKGSDPQQMIMSLQWEDWKQQTVKYFTALDDSLLPVDTSSTVDVGTQCYIIANSPHYITFGEVAKQRGLTVRKSFNGDYEKLLPETKGNLLLIETHEGTPIVDIKTLQSFFPTLAPGKQSGKHTIDKTILAFIEVENYHEQIATIAKELEDVKP